MTDWNKRIYDYSVVNVFSEKGLYGGNQLAVFLNPADLTIKEMQGITREFNFSEVTFVSNKDDTGARVRIFTPGGEIPYAGHPTIGTAYELEKNHRKEGNSPRLSFKLNLKAGNVEIHIENLDQNKIGRITFDQILPQGSEVFSEIGSILKSLSLTKKDLLEGKELQLIRSVLKFDPLFIPLKSVDSVSKIKLNLNSLNEELREIGANVYVFTLIEKSRNEYRARFFAPLLNVPEDPATGGVQSSFGQCLLNLNLLEEGRNSISIEQGYEMGRPSKIYDTFTVENGKLAAASTGGNNYHVAEGKLFLT
jgi:trans-2,3-dihydro-3-hydroxyanthranilate isomerase